MSIFTIKQGDLLPAIAATLMEGVGTVNEGPAPVTDADTVKFLMRRIGETTPTVNAAADWADQPASQVRYAWVSGDTATAGTYECEWEVTWPSGKKMTFPSAGYDTVRIFDDIA